MSGSMLAFRRVQYPSPWIPTTPTDSLPTSRHIVPSSLVEHRSGRIPHWGGTTLTSNNMAVLTISSSHGPHGQASRCQPLGRGSIISSFPWRIPEAYINQITRDHTSTFAQKRKDSESHTGIKTNHGLNMTIMIAHGMHLRTWTCAKRKQNAHERRILTFRSLWWCLRIVLVSRVYVCVPVHIPFEIFENK